MPTDQGDRDHVNRRQFLKATGALLAGSSILGSRQAIDAQAQIHVPARGRAAPMSQLFDGDVATALIAAGPRSTRC